MQLILSIGCIISMKRVHVLQVAHLLIINRITLTQSIWLRLEVLVLRIDIIDLYRGPYLSASVRVNCIDRYLIYLHKQKNGNFEDLHN